MKFDNLMLEKFSSLKDGSIKLTFITRELSPSQMAEIVCNLNKEVVELDVPDEISGNKSTSQRLRDRMFVFYKDKHGTSDNFRNWHTDEIDKIGQIYLDRMNNTNPMKSSIKY